MESSLAETMGVRSGPVGEELNKSAAALDALHNKSQLHNIVGSLWQARQESSGSSLGNQSPRNGEDLSEGEPGSPTDSAHEVSQNKEREHDDVELASDLRLPRDYPFFPGFGGLPGLPALEALNKQKELLGSNIILPVSSPQGLLKAPSNLFPPHPFPPLRPPSQPTSQSNSPSDFGTQQNWSFEEQFKQLYEIDDNPKRKEFLDELFAFMQKRGTPINRLPIMAKQVLDLYELYNLVVARGGLVEVINKKQWQEIIKGLGLPSSITSAAFTLRTQYTKYLYPLEIQQHGFSSNGDLQNAIDGNKREGRRLAPYDMPHHQQSSPLGFPTRLPHSPTQSPPHSQADQMAQLEMTRLALWKLYSQGQAPPPPPQLLPLPPLDLDIRRREHEQRMAEEQKEQLRLADEMRREEARRRITDEEQPAEKRVRVTEEDEEEEEEVEMELEVTKRARVEPRVDARAETGDNKSMTISMEVNGILYTGTLYAKPR